MKRLLVLSLFILFATSCAGKRVKPTDAPTPCTCPPAQQPVPEIPKAEEPKPPSSMIPEYGLLKAARWEEVDGFSEDSVEAAWSAWLQSCNGLRNKPKWQAACQTAKAMDKPSRSQVSAYFNDYFEVYRATNPDESDTGLITGYYEPVLKGSRSKTPQSPYPLYRQPDDLITVELSDLYPELKYKRVRGRLLGNKLVPYLTRAEIDTDASPLSGNEIAWVTDSIELFFLQIQGSGLIQLDDGRSLHVGYADQNGHPYSSIGRLLVDKGELTKDQASMQGIKQWAAKNPHRLRELLAANPSYVFFRELPANLPGPLGALGVPITAERSVAVDPKFIPLGAPVFLSTTQPMSSAPLKRLMMAQDTGGAIKGGVRADFFWGAGDEAGKQAGAMKQSGKLWVLLPKGFFGGPP